MATRPILVFGDPRLEAPNAAVTHFGPELAALAEELFLAGWAAPGLGVAAPQLGDNRRLAVVDLSVGKRPEDRLVLANPEIIASEGAVSLEEGCLSFPGIFTTLTRPRRIRLRAQSIDGAPFELGAEGLLAQAICHEVDHLDGTLLVHHLRGLKRTLFLRRVAKMRALGLWTT